MLGVSGVRLVARTVEASGRLEGLGKRPWHGSFKQLNHAPPDSDS